MIVIDFITTYPALSAAAAVIGASAAWRRFTYGPAPKPLTDEEWASYTEYTGDWEREDAEYEQQMADAELETLYATDKTVLIDEVIRLRRLVNEWRQHSSEVGY